ncbi:tripartite tricarboxylate transporter TctB family protein [Bosea sp. NPDC055594]
MKVNNLGLGIIAAFAALCLGIAGIQLPNPSKQIYGPGFFPLLLAVLLGVTAVALVVEGGRQRAAPLISLQPWTRNPVFLLRFAAIPAGVAFYVLCVGTLGFLPTVSLLLLALFLSLGVRWQLALAVAVGAALLMHSLFHLGLRVQLPWGLLEPIRW